MTHSNWRQLRSVVVGAGSYLPENVVTNKDLEEKLETTDAWIVQRTGITCRHVAAAGRDDLDIGDSRGASALADANLQPDDIDLIIVATSTPDFTFPSVATQIQAALGMTGGAAFDLQAVCSGFVYAVATADKFLISGSHRRALVIGAETFSRIFDWEDRTTCVLFGDGAAALVFEAQQGDGNERRSRGPDLAPALRRAPSRKTVRRWRSVVDPDDRASADGRPARSSATLSAWSRTS